MGKRRSEEMQPRTGKLTVEEIEEIHRVFIEIGGYVNKTARHTGFSKSTVSRYVKKNGWRKELPHDSMEQLDQRTEREDIINGLPFPGKNSGRTTSGEDKGSEEAEEQTMTKLVALRELLFEEIMGNEKAETVDEPSLVILPRTLAEAVKALIDIDKRIIEREGTQPVTMLDAYQNILARCARIVEDELG